MHIGFTGTQAGMSDLQKAKLKQYLDPSEAFHHGDCIGADSEASTEAELIGMRIFCHPPINPNKRAFKPYDVILPRKEYLERNHDIVETCDYLIACPKETVEQVRSGTWATIRYARKAGKKVIIIFPDGSVSDD